MLLVNLTFELAPATAGAIACRRCNGPIAPGETCVARTEPWFAVNTDRHHYHPRCAVDLDARAAAKAFDGATLAFDDRDELTRLALARVAGIEALAKRSPLPELEPARDPQGRPRVRILIAGSAMSFGKRPQSDFAQLVTDDTWRSPKREYFFVPQWDAMPSPAEDPSQPVIAAVYASHAKVKLMRSQQAKAAAWRMRGLPTPVLWLLGAAHPEDLDEHERDLREFIDAAGYRGDDAVVLRADAVDPAAMDALVAALDALAPWGQPPTTGAEDGAADLAERTIAVLDELAREGRYEAMPAAIDQAHKPFESARGERRHAIARALAACLPHAGASTHHALYILGHAVEDATVRAAVLAWLRDEMTSGSTRRGLSQASETACRALARVKEPGLPLALVDGYRATGSSERRAAIATWRRASKSAPAAASLRAWAQTLPTRDARRRSALELARRLAPATKKPAARKAKKPATKKPARRR